MTYFDMHVHARDFNEAHKDTIERVLRVAADSGVSGIIAMPNTNPPILTLDDANLSLKKAHDANIPEVFFAQFMGLQADRGQVRGAMDAYRRLFPRVPGMKLYLGHSTNNLGVISYEHQFMVMEELSSGGYDGFLVVHAEKESCLDKARWNPDEPISHAFARPAQAEIDSIADICSIAIATKFPGKLHVAHISTSAGVDRVYQAKREGLDISCGVCPHHLFYDWNQMLEPDGLQYKMNPPLRAPGEPEALRLRLLDGRINWLETDHASHTREDKLGLNVNRECASGVVGLFAWDLFADALRFYGFSDRMIEAVTYTNVLERIGLDVPRNTRLRRDHTDTYQFNPWRDLAEQIRV